MLAKEDVTVVDEFGVGRKLKAGQPVPANLTDAYAEATGADDMPADAASESEPPKPERHLPKRRRSSGN